MTTRIEGIKPIIRVSAKQSVLRNVWTYDQDNLTYNESEYTYDGVYTCDIFDSRTRIEGIKPLSRIK